MLMAAALVSSCAPREEPEPSVSAAVENCSAALEKLVRSPAKGQDLGVEGSPASEERSERANDGQNGRDHARIRLGEMRELLNDFQAVEILGRHTPVAEEVRVEVGDSRWGPSAVGRRRPQHVPAEPYDLGHTLSVRRRDTLSTSCGLATHGFESPKARRSSPTRIATSPP